MSLERTAQTIEHVVERVRDLAVTHYVDVTQPIDRLVPALVRIATGTMRH